MNTTLDYDQFPAIEIKPRERSTYIALLDSAIEGFREDGSSSENPITPYIAPGWMQRGFYDFLGNKVLSNLEASECRLRCLPKYSIELDTNSPGAMYSAKKILCGWFNRRSNQGVYQVRLNREKQSLQVVGDIPFETVDHILNDLKCLRGYKIKTI